MSNIVYELMAVLGLNTKPFEDGLEGSKSEAESFGSKISSALKTTAKVGAAAIGAAGTALGAITKQAVEGYADYEQLVGGVETLFKGSANDVIQYASNAYKTAGMSSNEYMETVTSFSASLLQSLGGDTKKAANMADLAMTDMSDNANKMGTSMESITNAYQGFAKQNYTMLDNLKLGYGGTKTEMERLVADAEKLNSSFKATRDENGNLTLSFADIVQAIHIVQDNLGITGTTAKEASTTISGSINSMKAAWANLIVGVADENANFKVLVDNFISTLVGDGSGEGGVINNLIPRIRQAIQGIGKLVVELAPIIGTYLPQLISDLLPPLISAATSLVFSFGSALVKALPGIKDSIVAGIWALLDSLGLGETVRSFIESVSGPVSEALENIRNTASDAFERIKATIQPLLDKFSEYVSSGQAMETASNLFSTAITFLGDAISAVIDFTATVIEKIASFIEWLNSGSAGAEAFKAVIVGLVAAFATFEIISTVISLFTALSSIVTVVQGAFAAFNAILLANPIGLVIAAIAALVAAFVYLWNNCEGFRQFWIDLWEKIKEIFSSVVEKVKADIEAIKLSFELLKVALGVVKDWFVEKINGIKESWNSFKQKVSDGANSIKKTWQTLTSAASNAASSIKSKWENAKDWGANLITKIQNGVSEKSSSLPQSIGKIGENIGNYWKKFSDASKTYGSAILASLASGIVSKVSDVYNVYKQIIENIMNSVRQVIDAAKSWGSGLMSSFINGIVEKFNGLVDKLKQIGSAIKSYLHFTQPDKGPLSGAHGFESYAPDMMKTFAKGITDNANLVTNAVSKSFDVGDQIAGFGDSAVIRRGGTQGVGGGVRNMTTILQLDRYTLGRVVYELYNEEQQRVGVKMAGGIT